MSVRRGTIAALVGALCALGLGLWEAPGQPAPASRIALEPIMGARFEGPLYVTDAGDAADRLFVVEQSGRIRVVQSGQLLIPLFLDISDRILAGGERGLLGLAFHPQYRANGRYAVNYTRRPDGATVVAEYRASREGTVSEREEKALLVIPQPYDNHNGGMVEFGPDGFLYIAMGDGGSAGDPENRAQNPNELLGKILRIDVDRGAPYAIPPDNPFAAGGGRPEIFALGLRNPWRFSFDRTTGELWAADVGQHEWEEIDIIRRGGNYGWRIMEGAHCFRPKVLCPTAGLTLPVAEYRNRRPRCSITGGYVYRGSRLAGLSGTYVFGDYCSGEILGLKDNAQRLLLSTELKISSFGQDRRGELYATDHADGTVYRIVPAPR